MKLEMGSGTVTTPVIATDAYGIATHRAPHSH